MDFILKDGRATGTLPSKMIANMASEISGPIELPKISLRIFTILLDAYKDGFHEEDWLLDYDNDTLYELLNTIDLLDMPELLDLSTTIIAKRLESEPIEAVKEFLNITEEFDEETLEQIKKEQAWFKENIGSIYD